MAVDSIANAPLRASSGGRARGALIAVSLALFCIQVDFFALNLALPDIGRTFHAGPSELQWSISAYMLSLGSLFIIAGRIGDIFGRRRVLLGGIAVFGLASAACAMAPNLEFLVAFRVIQGTGAAVIFPVGIAALSNEFSDDARAAALGLAFGIANIGTALGPFVGGGLSQGPGWRWIFWLMVPLTGVSLIIAARTVRNSRDEAAPRRLDVAGAILIGCSVAALSITIDRAHAWGWGSAPTIAGFIVAAASLTAFVLLERRIRFPLVRLTLFRNVPYVLVTWMGAVSNIGYAVIVFAETLYLQSVRGLSPLTAGIVFVGPSLLVALSGPVGARLGKYFRPSAVMAGAGVLAGCGLMALTFAHGWPVYILVFAVTTFGFGIGWTFANVATQAAVRPERAGEASGVMLTIIVTAGGVGVAAAASAIGDLHVSGVPLHAAIEDVLRILAGIVIAAAGITLAVRHELVRRGLTPPLSMKADWTPPEVGHGS
ncbi:MAG TPA: MFS transporter [Solirubrobacteraceae bacterium]|nr:MFS transporter [Solirubrobacteraceae bacterium]